MAWMVLLSGAALGALGCGNDSEHASTGAGGSDGGGGSGSVEAGGSTGSGFDRTISGGDPTKEAKSAGIDGCNAKFVDPDGVCRPAASKCPVGTIPNIDEGCVAVGVAGCNAAFVDARGVCLPNPKVCLAGTFPVPALGCVSFDGDSGCGSAPYGNVTADAANIYVDGSFAGDDSDGSSTKPFSTVSAALAVATDGSRLVLAEGTYSGAISLDHAVSIAGRCASMVKLTGAVAPTPELTMNASGASTVSGVTIDAKTIGVWIHDGDVSMKNVVVTGTINSAVVVSGAATKATIDRALIEDTAIDTLISPVNGTGIGLVVVDADVAMSESALQRTFTGGVFQSGGKVTLSDVLVDETKADAAGNASAIVVADHGGLQATGLVVAKALTGIEIGESCAVDLQGSVVAAIDFNGEGGITTVDETGRITMTGSTIADVDTPIDVDGPAKLGNNLFVDAGGSVFNGKLSSSHDVFLRPTEDVMNPADTTTIEADVFDSDDAASATAVSAIDLEMTRSYVRNLGMGVYVDSYQTSAKAKINRSTFENLGAAGEGESGIGVAGVDENLTVTNTLIANVRGAGILAKGTTLIVEGTRISKVATSAYELEDVSASKKETGDGIVFFKGSGNDFATIEDTVVESCARAGFLLSTKTHVLRNVSSVDNTYGVVSEDDAKVSFSGSDVAKNGKHNYTDEADLPTPK